MTRLAGLVGRMTARGLPPPGPTAGIAVIVGLKMQRYVENEMVRDLLGEEVRKLIRSHAASASCPWAIDERRCAGWTQPATSDLSMAQLSSMRKPKRYSSRMLSEKSAFSMPG